MCCAFKFNAVLHLNKVKSGFKHVMQMYSIVDNCTRVESNLQDFKEQEHKNQLNMA